jgi:hypothetical protein
MRFLIITCLLSVLVACSSSIVGRDAVEIESDICIMPFSDYEYRTCKAIKFRVGGRTHEVPKNFITDLASIPRLYWVVLNPSRSDIMGPAIVHDYLYQCPNGMSRKHIDEVFYYALRDNNVGWWGSTKMYIAVYFFGGKHFQKRPSVYCPGTFKKGL